MNEKQVLRTQFSAVCDLFWILLTRSKQCGAICVWLEKETLSFNFFIEKSLKTIANLQPQTSIFSDLKSLFNKLYLT